MIYTVTFNPSLDYIVQVNNLKLGIVNRADKEVLFPGGKGINVSIVLKNLGLDSRILGFTGGFTGDEIERLLIVYGCICDFIRLENGFSRINIKIKSKEESEINAQGPLISNKKIEELFIKLDTLKDGDTLVLAGSIPNTLPIDIYENILKRLSEKKIYIVVDATKNLLLNVLKYHPFLIKPNNIELGEMFSTVLKTDEEIVKCAKELQNMGAKNVLVSMAGDGAIFISENGDIYKCSAPKGKVVNSVGAGDSMVAGFLFEYFKSYNYQKAFKTGIATGSASAFSEWLPEKNDIFALLDSL